MSASADPQRVEAVNYGDVATVSSDGQADLDSSITGMLPKEGQKLAQNHLASSLFNSHMRRFCEKPSELWAMFTEEKS